MIGSKGVEKSVIHANDTIEFWDCGNNLTPQTLKGSNSTPLGMKQEQMHSLYLIQHQKKAVKNV